MTTGHALASYLDPRQLGSSGLLPLLSHSARPGLMGLALCVGHRLLARQPAAHVVGRGARVQTGAVTVIQRFG